MKALPSIAAVCSLSIAALGHPIAHAQDMQVYGQIRLTVNHRVRIQPHLHAEHGGPGPAGLGQSHGLAAVLAGHGHHLVRGQ